MTVDEGMAKVEQEIDEFLAVRESYLTDDELEAWNRETLAEIRTGLERWLRTFMH